MKKSILNDFINYSNTLPRRLAKREQEELLIKFYETRSEEIRQFLLEHNLRLCANISLKYAMKYNIEKLVFDLFSECSLALAKALDLFNPYNENQASFSTFSVNGMNFALMNFYYNEIANTSKLDDINFLASDEEDSDINPFDFFIDENESGLIDMIANKEMLKQVMSVVSEKNKEIIEMYLGINRPKLTQLEIAREFKSSQTKICRVIKKEIRNMQYFIATNYASSYPQLAKKYGTLELNSNLISKLTTKYKRNNYIFNSFYGINNHIQKTLVELGLELNMSEQAISTIVKKLTNELPEEEKACLLDRLNHQKLKLSIEIFHQYYNLKAIKPITKIDLANEYNLSYNSISKHILNATQYLIQEGAYTKEDIDNFENIRKEQNNRLIQSKQKKHLEECEYCYLSYYGLNDYKKKSQLVLANEFNVSHQTICQFIKEYETFLKNNNSKTN